MTRAQAAASREEAAIKLKAITLRFPATEEEAAELDQDLAKIGLRAAPTPTLGFAGRPHGEGIEGRSAQPVQEHNPGKAQYVNGGHMEEDVWIWPRWCRVLRPE